MEINGHTGSNNCKINIVYPLLTGLLILSMFTGHTAIADNIFTINGQPVELNVQFVSVNTARISILPIQSDETTIGLGTSLILSDLGGLQPEYQSRILSNIHPVQLENNKYNITLMDEKLTFRFKHAKGEIVKEFLIDTVSGNISFKLDGTPVFGLGQGAKQFDRMGALYPMEVGSNHWKMKEYGGRVPVPWLISPDGWGIFFHKPSGSIDLRNDKATFLPREKILPLDFFVVLVESQIELFKEYGKLTGFSPIPPRWTLGYMQSHRTLAGPQEVLKVAETFREKNLPCDALIYLGTGWCPAGWNQGHGSFDFNPQVFPEPSTIFEKLKSLNFHPVLHIVFPPENLYGTINSQNISVDDSGHVVNYWVRHRHLKEQGAEGWWPDSGEKLSLNGRVTRIRMYYEGDRQDYNSRTFALHRTGFAGMQRYAGWLWSGDVYSTWEKLGNQIPMGLNTGVSGIIYWGTDIGGFWSTSELTGELYVRWFQFGTFCPLFRSHGRNWHTRLPWGWNTGDPGPIEVTANPPGQSLPDSEELHNPLVEPICRKYLNLRYQLLPYNYSLAFEATEKGLPFMRPLWLYYSDQEVMNIQDQYLWGKDIMVAPVTLKNATTRSLYLPKGEWYDFWTSEMITGGKEIVREVDLVTMPIYVRAGAVIPKGPQIQHTGEFLYGPLTIEIYPGKDGEFVLYEDDGQSYSYIQGMYMKTGFYWDDANATLLVAPENEVNLCPQKQRKITVQLVTSKLSKSFTYHGTSMQISF
jgi:alpha-glucosidase/alpha-D-xyloside xylohydrolase